MKDLAGASCKHEEACRSSQEVGGEKERKREEGQTEGGQTQPHLQGCKLENHVLLLNKGIGRFWCGAAFPGGGAM